MQIKDDGTHVILPATAHEKVHTDRVGLPVMWLRHTDGKVRRDDHPAACMQPIGVVDERGRLHGAPGLVAWVEHRVHAWIRGPCRERERKREWLTKCKNSDRLRRQDKSADVCRAHMVGWIEIFRRPQQCGAGASAAKSKSINAQSAIAGKISHQRLL